MSIKTKEEIEARKAGVQNINEYEEFKKGAEKDLPLSNKSTASSIEKTQLSELSKLDEWQLADKFEQLDGDYHLLKWNIASLIKGKFKSDKLYGQFLQELRDRYPSHPLCMIKTATLRRYYKAAEICNTLKILNLKAVGLSPTIIYELGELKNKEKLEDIYNQIKNENPLSSKKKKKDAILEVFQKNPKVQDVQRLIKQADSIDGEVIHPLLEVLDIDNGRLQSESSEIIVNDVINQQKINDEIVERVLDFINSFSISVLDKRLILDAVLLKLE